MDAQAKVKFLARTAFLSHKAGMPGFTREEIRCKLMEVASASAVDEALKVYDSSETPAEVWKQVENANDALTALGPAASSQTVFDTLATAIGIDPGGLKS